MRHWLALFGLLFLICAGGIAQDTVVIKGTVSDAYSQKRLSYVNVIDSKQSVTYNTDGNGQFTLTTVKNDTLFLFYPGYQTCKFSVADSAVKAEYKLNLTMERLSTGLSQPVIIKAAKTLEQIEEERKKLGITPRELERPELSFTSPISALYELLSNRAHEREKLKKQIREDERQKIFKELCRYYNENALIDLPEENFDDFDRFCGLTLDFIKTASDYELTKAVVGMYNKYARLNGLIK